MITVKKIFRDEELYFVWADGKCFAFFYLLSSSGEKPVWAVSGEYKPLAANIDDFNSYDDALKFIMAHAPVQ
ncbi:MULTISPECIES: hypothetical protein [unclassified Mesorhizobium]|uniref:hypothetical protein n=1 Tax=unclassified Mesorhizobium TaxID=325217 RepID=UPI000BAE908E|nr:MULTISPECIES: hypothetical protein [unclassified Mesorhizobium]TGT61039.1 hypothetical protein EN813_018935 [Mesorhizobium sp. M00.F.Ca.ET.170.01.1.1]AZO08808.1 hypothetical protein EJ074_06560 [Mesorhizobium sp. M3A.F.Ca.ET.080.04.2.1]PBB84047.1 hypothetical protein CK216_24995 [Mesorhizobium sp. WSM3876]RWB65623.1 MAG: hypothetical protein EOQ49_31500 [Mesorhizobium sp.]RWB83728.1 MAG: hypothetical protein EOQ52_26385 [Mesorhizobium sp.]